MGVVNYCGFSNTHELGNQYAEPVKSGKLGKIMRAHATYDQDMLDLSIPIAWRHITVAGLGASATCAAIC